MVIEKLPEFAEFLMTTFVAVLATVLSAFSLVHIVLVLVQVLLLLSAFYYRKHRKTITRSQILIYLLALILLCCMTLWMYVEWTKETPL